MADMRTVFAETATALLDEDPLAAVVLAEISADMFGKAAARYPDRVLNVGIREQLMVSVGGGLALAGRAGLRAGQAGPRAPGRARRAGQHRGVVRRGPGRPNAPGAGGRCLDGQRPGVLGGRAGAPVRGRGAAARGAWRARVWLYL